MSHLTPVPSDPDSLREWLIQRREADVDLGFEWRNPKVDLPPAPAKPRALTLHVALQETSVWRRIVVPGDTTLDRVHDVIQAAMGWADSHLHRFFTTLSPRAPYFVTQLDLEDGEDGTPEDQVRLDQLLPAVGDSVLYEYDLGDGWGHELKLEGSAALKDDGQFRCTGGDHACPPEDVGGVGGYAEVAAWVRGGRRPDDVPPGFESFEHADTWLPRGWDPDAFDLDATNARLRALTISSAALERLRPGAQDAVRRLSPRAQGKVSAWAAAAQARSLTPADVDDLTSPYRALLEAVGDGVQLSAAGYLPADLVRTLCPALEIDPILAGKANRESNILPLLMFRTAAQHAGLLQGSRRTLEPVPVSRELLRDPAALWRHVAERLPYSEGELDAEIGWFTLLAVAGGAERYDVFRAVHELCVDAGWKDDDGKPIARHHVSELMWPTLAALIGARWNSREAWPGWVPAAAAAVIFGEPTG